MSSGLREDLVIGVDIGGTKVAAGLVDPSGEILCQARNPMVCAYLANDLQLLSGGRFVLGLGSQIRPHIEKRFGQPWSKPNARMREFVQALRAIWRAWDSGERLEFRGAFATVVPTMVLSLSFVTVATSYA